MVFSIPEAISWKNLESGIVLLDLVNGAYYTLNETATVIMQCVLDGKTEQDIIAIIMKEYDCEEARATNDVQEQLAFLINEGLLVKK
jgi:hypothetical protein